MCAGPYLALYFGSIFAAFCRVSERGFPALRGPYRYLPDSVAQFPEQDALAVKLQTAGFHRVSYVNFTGGVAALHVGEKL